MVRLTNKFVKDVEYADRNFKDFEKIFMLWTPVAKNTKLGSKHNPYQDIEDIKINIKKGRNVDLIVVANKDYLNAINELRKIAAATTPEMTSPIMRFMQIEETLKKL